MSQFTNNSPQSHIFSKLVLSKVPIKIFVINVIRSSIIFQISFDLANSNFIYKENVYLKSRINEMLQCKCYTTFMIILGDATCLHLIGF